MSDRLELPERYRKQVKEILRDRVPHAEVCAYGSRVDGTSYEASDLDLVVRAPGLKTISAMDMEALREAFRDSNIPIIVEARDWARLSKSGFTRQECSLCHEAAQLFAAPERDGASLYLGPSLQQVGLYLRPCLEFFRYISGLPTSYAGKGFVYNQG